MAIPCIVRKLGINLSLLHDVHPLLRLLPDVLDVLQQQPYLVLGIGGADLTTVRLVFPGAGFA